jgi:small neutral amino acid transporter SnatA (MarC family)
MDPIDFIKVLAVTLAALFPVVNRIGDAPIFLSLTRHYSHSAQDIFAEDSDVRIRSAGWVILFGRETLFFFGA